MKFYRTFVARKLLFFTKNAGNIIVRQRGTVHRVGQNIGIGKDHTLFALIDGTVEFKKKRDNKSYVSIKPIIVAIEAN